MRRRWAALLIIYTMLAGLFAAAPVSAETAESSLFQALNFEDGNVSDITYSFTTYADSIEEHKGTASIETDSVTGSKALKVVTKIGEEAKSGGGKADNLKFHIPALPEGMKKVTIQFDMRNEDYANQFRAFYRFGMLTRTASNVYGGLYGSGTGLSTTDVCCDGNCNGSGVANYYCGLGNNVWRRVIYTLDLVNDRYETVIYNKIYEDASSTRTHSGPLGDFKKEDGSIDLIFQTYFSEYGTGSSYVKGDAGIYWIDNVVVSDAYAQQDDFENPSNISRRIVANSTAVANGRGSTVTVETDPTTKSKAMKFVSKLTSADGSGADAVHFTIPAFPDDVNFLEVSMDVRQENNGVWKWFEQFASLGNVNGSGLRNYSLSDVMVHEAGGTTPIGYWNWKDGEYHNYKYLIDLRLEQAQFFLDGNLIWSGAVNKSSLFNTNGTMVVRFNSKWSGNSGFETAGDAILWIDNLSAVGSNVIYQAEVVNSAPKHNATNVEPGDTISFELNSPVTSLDSEKIKLYIDGARSTAFTAALSENGTVITVAPDSGLQYGATYKVELADGYAMPANPTFENPAPYTLGFKTRSLLNPMSNWNEGAKFSSGFVPEFTPISGVEYALTLAKDGGSAVNYSLGTPIDEGGYYVLTIKATNAADGATQVKTYAFEIIQPVEPDTPSTPDAGDEGTYVLHFEDAETENVGWSFKGTANAGSYATVETDTEGGSRALKVVSNTKNSFSDFDELIFDFSHLDFSIPGKYEIKLEFRVENLTRDFSTFAGLETANGTSDTYFKSSTSYALFQGSWSSYLQLKQQYQCLKYVVDTENRTVAVYKDGTYMTSNPIQSEITKLKFSSFVVNNQSMTNYADGKSSMVYWIDNLSVRRIPLFKADLRDESGLAIGRLADNAGETITANIEVNLQDYSQPASYSAVLALKAGGKLVDIKLLNQSDFVSGKGVATFDIPAVQEEAHTVVAYFMENMSTIKPLELSVTMGNKALGRIEYFVSNAGSEKGNGSFNNPFNSIEKARDAIYRLKRREGYPAGGVTVTLREGVYRAPDGIEFTGSDSGTDTAPIEWRGYPGEKVVIKGSEGISFDEFFEVSDDARIPASAKGQVYVCKLADAGIQGYAKLPSGGHGAYYLNAAGWSSEGYSFSGYLPIVSVDEEILDIARYPNREDGYLQVASGSTKGSYGSESSGAEKTGMNISVSNIDRERLLKWKNAAENGDFWAYGFWYYDWSDLATPIESVNVDTKKMLSVLDSPNGIRSGQRYYVYNLLEELDAPGEWYYDSNKDQLFVYLPQDKAGTSPTVNVAFQSKHLFTVNGAKNMIFRNLAFEDSKLTTVLVTNSDHILLENCEMRNSSADGLSISGTNVRANKCLIENNAQTGVAINGGDTTNLISSNNVLSNCTIRDFGRIWKTMVPGINVLGVGQHVHNNLVEGGPHMGILFSGNDNLIEYNIIRDVLWECNDAGAIYCGQSVVSRGNVVRRNLITDILSDDSTNRWVYGIYLDGRYCGATITENIISNLGSPGSNHTAIFVNGGRNNTVTHNMIVNAGTGIEYEGVIGTVTYENDVANDASLQKALKNPAFAKYPNFMDMPTDDPLEPKYGVVDNNLVFNVQTPMVVSPGYRPVTLAWMYENNDLHDPVVATADIEFTDAANGDYTLKNTEQAKQWIPNFKTFSSDEVGPIR